MTVGWAHSALAGGVPWPPWLIVLALLVCWAVVIAATAALFAGHVSGRGHPSEAPSRSRRLGRAIDSGRTSATTNWCPGSKPTVPSEIPRALTPQRLSVVGRWWRTRVGRARSHPGRQSATARELWRKPFPPSVCNVVPRYRRRAIPERELPEDSADERQEPLHFIPRGGIHPDTPTGYSGLEETHEVCTGATGHRRAGRGHADTGATSFRGSLRRGYGSRGRELATAPGVPSDPQ
jgi:hypothetical protein